MQNRSNGASTDEAHCAPAPCAHTRILGQEKCKCKGETDEAQEFPHRVRTHVSWNKSAASADLAAIKENTEAALAAKLEQAATAPTLFCPVSKLLVYVSLQTTKLGHAHARFTSQTSHHIFMLLLLFHWLMLRSRIHNLASVPTDVQGICDTAHRQSADRRSSTPNKTAATGHRPTRPTAIPHRVRTHVSWDERNARPCTIKKYNAAVQGAFLATAAAKSTSGVGRWKQAPPKSAGRSPRPPQTLVSSDSLCHR